MSGKIETDRCVSMALVAVACLLLGHAALGQSQPGSGLGGIPAEDYANDVERQSAAANQQTFDQLDPLCNPGGVLDQSSNPSDPPASADPQCQTGDVFQVYLTIRELVHTANDISGNGPIIASLGLNQEGLGTALRWTAAEELAAQGSAATEFSSGQLSNLASRMSALRFGARGFTLSGFSMPNGQNDVLVAESFKEGRGSGASADNGGGTRYSAWGGFLNGTYNYGDKAVTDAENAFDFDGAEVTFGIDYRFQSNFVLGVMAGWTRQTIDFDEAADPIRVVDGSIESDGISGILFGLYQGQNFFASASVGYQTLDYDVERAIKYPSLNPDLDSANSIALSEPDADVVTATFDLAYAFNGGRFTFEPYLSADYIDVTINAFDEQRSRSAFDGMPDDNVFNLTVGEQKFDSLDAALGIRFQYTFTPNFGVIVPYAKIEAHKELINQSRTIFAGYGGDGVPSALTDPLTFAVLTDEIDEDYFTWAAGFSFVLRGGRQRQYDSPITGGLMAFVQYESLEQKENYRETIISGGIRYEF